MSSLNKKFIIFSICISVIYSFPFLLSNHLFIDDMGRNLYGYGWNNDGRFLATALMKLLSLGVVVTGIFPYSTILSCMAFFSSCYILTSQTSKFTQQTNLLIASTVFFSPFILENISYRYDSLPMALSVLACSIPFIFYKRNMSTFFLVSIPCLLFTCLTYQPSIIAYPLCTLIIASAIAREKSKASIKFCLLTLGCFMVATGLYFSLINVAGIKFYGHSASIATSFDVISERFHVAWGYIRGSLNIPQKSLIIISSITALLSVIFKSGIRGFTEKLLICCFIIIAFPLSVSLAVLLTNTNIVARVFLGFPFIVIFLLCMFNKSNEKAVRTLSVIMFLSSLPMVSAYSTALDDQYNFEKNIVASAFYNIDTTGKTITSEGSLPYATSVQSKIKNFPIIGSLILVTMREGWPWGDQFLEGQGIIKSGQYISGPTDVNGVAQRMLREKCTMIKIKSSLYYNLYIKDDMILLDFSKNTCQ